MKKKIVAMLLSIAVVSVTLSGCGLLHNSESTATKDSVATTNDVKVSSESLVSDTEIGEYETKEASGYETLSESTQDYSYDMVNEGDYASYSFAGKGDYSMEMRGDYENACEAVNDPFDSSEYYDDEFLIDSENEYCESEWYDEKVPHDNGEQYSKITENSPIEVAVNPLSTFAADVDTASMSNLRRMINDGYNILMIPGDAVRTEEMVNYFKYNYEEPSEGEIFGVNAQISSCPWNKSAYLMTIGVNTASMNTKDIPDCNIVFLVDVSGSMKSENKLPLIQKTMAMLVDKFDEKDRISIVTYASGVDTVLDGCKGNESAKIIKAFENLSAGGSTNGGDGIKRAYKIAEKNFIKDGVNRVIICSDGDFNVGLTTEKELEDLINKKKNKGVFLSTLGFGMGNYSDVTMETLADKGNGNYAYIDSLVEAKKVLIDEMTSTFVTVAKDVKLQVEFNPALVSKYRLVGYENRVMSATDFKDDSKDGGEMGAGHQVTAVYEIYKADDSDDIALKYQKSSLSAKGKKSDEFCTLSIAYKDIDKNESNYLEFPIGTECYTKKPSDDFRLAAALAQTSLALKDSQYLVDMDQNQALESSIGILKNLKKDYEGVDEFVDLMNRLFITR